MSHRFGTSAIVRVGRDAAPRGPMAGYRAAPPPQARMAMPSQVRVGRNAAQTQVGQAPGAAPAELRAQQPVVQPVPSGLNGGLGYCGNYDWSLACKRIIGTGRKSVAAGATVDFTVTPCGPYYIDCIIVPESFALNFEITSIKVCRDDFITVPIPAEGFSDQSDYACNLACGAIFFPSLPLIISVHNITLGAHDFSAMVIGREIAFCG